MPKGEPISLNPKNQGGPGQIKFVSVKKNVFKINMQPPISNYATKFFSRRSFPEN